MNVHPVSWSTEGSNQYEYYKINPFLLLFFWLFPQYFDSDAKMKIIDNILGLILPCLGYRQISNLMLQLALSGTYLIGMLFKIACTPHFKGFKNNVSFLFAQGRPERHWKQCTRTNCSLLNSTRQARNVTFAETSSVHLLRKLETFSENHHQLTLAIQTFSIKLTLLWVRAWASSLFLVSVTPASKAEGCLQNRDSHWHVIAQLWF